MLPIADPQAEAHGSIEKNKPLTISFFHFQSHPRGSKLHCISGEIHARIYPQTAYKELQTEHERLKTEYETVKTLCERTLEAYNAIQNDYKALQVELQQIRTQSHTEPHNARNAGRKPKFTNEQMEQVRKMAADGLSVRKIAAEMSCSIGLVCKILHSNKN